MPSRTAAWTLVALLGTSGGAWAAAATPDGAATLRGQLERYLGHGPVTVAPAGDAYQIDVDLKAALGALERFGVTLDPLTATLTAAPQDDGTWRVTGRGSPLATIRAGGRITSVAANNQVFDGVFDPRVPAFTHTSSSYDSLSVGTVGTEGDGGSAGAVQTRQLDHGTQTSAATPAGDGVVDVRIAQGNAAYAQEIAVDAAGGAQRIALKGGATSDTFTIDKLPVRALLDLWAFLVAHPTEAALKAGAAELKGKLRGALPGFARLAQDGSLEALTVATPLGPVAAGRLTSHFDLAGLTDTGRFELALKMEDLALPAAALPGWAAPLLPTRVELHDGLSGYRLDQAASTAIEALDPGAPRPLSPEAMEKVQASLGGRDTLVVSLGDNRITTPTLEARFGGEIRLAAPVPSFAVTVRASGLDKAIAAIRDKAKESGASQALAMLTLVKGYGRPDPDGSLRWVLAGDGTGAVTVNDVPLPIGPAK